MQSIFNKYNGGEINRAYCQPIQSICINDHFEFALNLYSMSGLVDINSIIWQDIIIEDQPKENLYNYKIEKKIENELDTSRKLFADFGRICEVEDSEVEWFNSSYEQLSKTLINYLDLFLPYFEVTKIETSQVDKTVYKIYLFANQMGIIEANYIGLDIKILNFNDICTNEVKKKGFIVDRNCPLELRINDSLILYISTSNK